MRKNDLVILVDTPDIECIEYFNEYNLPLDLTGKIVEKSFDGFKVEFNHNNTKRILALFEEELQLASARRTKTKKNKPGEKRICGHKLTTIFQ